MKKVIVGEWTVGRTEGVKGGGGETRSEEERRT